MTPSPTPPQPPRPFRAFISYARKDRRHLTTLLSHLATLQRQGWLETWTDQALRPGEVWEDTLRHKLRTADLILLLISPDFMASDYIQEIELETALQRHADGTARIIPIVTRPTDLNGTQLDRLQALPLDRRPVSRWKDKDSAWLNVVEGLRRVLSSWPPGIRSGPMDSYSCPTVSCASTHRMETTAAPQSGMAPLKAPADPSRPSGVRILTPGSWSDTQARLQVSVVTRTERALAKSAANLGQVLKDGSIPSDLELEGLTTLDKISPGSRIEGLLESEVITVSDCRWYGPDVLRVDFVRSDGSKGTDFVDGQSADTMTIVGEPGTPHFWRYPAGVPRLFSSKRDLFPILRSLYSRRRIAPLITAFADRLIDCLSAPMYRAPGGEEDPETEREPHAYALVPTFAYVTLDTKEGADMVVHEIETDPAPSCVRLAFVPDPELDRTLHDLTVRRLRDSDVQLIRFSQAMLQGSFEDTVMKLLPVVESTVVRRSQDQLELVEIGLTRGCKSWERIPDLPFGFRRREAVLDDPVFYVDMRNTGDWQARISSAYCYIRLNRPKGYGFFPEGLLKPVCTITIPVDPLGGTYFEAPPEYPVLVNPATHQRIDLRLEGVGAVLRGEVNIGLVFGPGKVLHLPTLIIIT